LFKYDCHVKNNLGFIIILWISFQKTVANQFYIMNLQKKYDFLNLPHYWSKEAILEIENTQPQFKQTCSCTHVCGGFEPATSCAIDEYSCHYAKAVFKGSLSIAACDVWFSVLFVQLAEVSIKHKGQMLP
jgi:hypothetical protein